MRFIVLIKHSDGEKFVVCRKLQVSFKIMMWAGLIGRKGILSGAFAIGQQDH
jgi:hypothetical protein